MYRLIWSHGKEYLSEDAEALIGNEQLKIYGRLHCPSALHRIAKGEFARHRVVFEDEEEALVARYRPCVICMKEHYELWKADRLMTHALDVVEPGYYDGPGLCTVCLANGNRKTLASKVLKDLDPDGGRKARMDALILNTMEDLNPDDIREYDWSCYELAEFRIDGDYCIATLLSWGRFWGRVIIWNYVQDQVIHLTNTPFAICSAIFHDKVISMYLAKRWGEIIKTDWTQHPLFWFDPSNKISCPNGTLWYSVVPLGTVNLEYEPDLCLLPLSVPDCADDAPDCFDIRVEGDTLVFRAGTAEYRLESL